MRSCESPELEAVLREALGLSGAPPRFARALEHAVFPGGARVRPLLCIEVARAAGTISRATYSAAAAVELIHCASLVHDDLPCFDDAATRRGKPSVHRAFDVPTALLVGDALIVAAFAELARSGLPAHASLVLANAAGAPRGLVAGQALELEGAPVDLAAYHLAKTAVLFEAAAALGASSAGADDVSAYATVGRLLGIAFQRADDIADHVATEAELGKPVGRDLALGRPSAAAAGSGSDLFRDAARAAIEAVPASADALARFVRGVLGVLASRCHLAAAAE